MTEEQAVASSNHPDAAREPVLVAVHRIDEELLRDVQDACTKAHARYVAWSGELSLPSLRRSPSVLVTGLRVGERRIPDDVLDLATTTYPELSIVVLSREPLLRPTMSLNNGRVTLVSPPLTSARLASALRGLLSDHHQGYMSTDTAPGLVEARSPVNIRRYRRAEYFAGVLSASKPDAPPMKLPVVRQSRTDGITIIVPKTRTTRELSINAVAASFRNDRNDAERSAALAELLGEDAGVIHLDGTAEEWIVYWPDKHWPLILSSPLRLPNVWSMSQSMERMGKNLIRFHAAHCDMLAAMTRVPLADEGEDTPITRMSALQPALGEGVASLLELFERRLREHPLDLLACVIEVF